VAEITRGLLDQLGQFSTPSIANAIETFDIQPRDQGFMAPDIKCMFPSLGNMVGHAVTAVITAKDKSAEYMEESNEDYFNMILSVPEPRVMVIQDLDYPNPIGSFWGEVNANIHKALGCLGLVTDGGVRDLDEMLDLGFFAFASEVLVSHAYVHIVDMGVPVTVGGLQVNNGDIIVGDKHGVLSVPNSIAADVPGATRRVEESEQALISLCQSPDFTVEKLNALFEEMSGG